MKRLKNILFTLIIISTFTFIPYVNAEENYNDVETNYQENSTTTTITTEDYSNIDNALNENTPDEKYISNNIIYVEVFCGVIAIIIIIMANKTTD